jgi:23S rRNA pseudouridine1911/1915/1917 synthase
MKFVPLLLSCLTRCPVERLFEIIYEDEELLAINKPAGLVCHPTKGDEYSSLISRVRLYLGKESRPHMVNRLDRETSGVTVVAKTDEAAREVRQLIEGREVGKEYLAIVHGHVATDSGLIDAPLGKDVQSRVAVKDCVRPDGAASQTEFQVLKRFDQISLVALRENFPELHFSADAAGPQPFSLLRVHPKTGRKHQIRIHLAHLGHPIVGDKIYGADEDRYLALVEDRLTTEQREALIFQHHALHAAALRFTWHGKEIEFRCEPETWFSRFVESAK